MIDIAAILKDHEKTTLEVKKAAGGIPNSLWDTYSAFANTFGGTIILGIEEDLETKQFIAHGVQDPKKMLSDLWNTLNNSNKVSTNIMLDNHIYTTDYQDMHFVVLEVPRADRLDNPVYIGVDPFKGSFRRNHEGDYHYT